MTRRAVIDIGTNSVKLLVADLDQGAIRPVLECSEQTRLGRGFYTDHRLRAEPIAHTARVVAGFARRAHEGGASLIRLLATSAARDARNAEELLAAIRQASGLEVEIISGEQEAEWAFRGAVLGQHLDAQPVLILDVGGGSTEFILGAGATLWFRQSFALGVVRLLERIRLAEPPSPDDLERCLESISRFLQTDVAPNLQPALAAHHQAGIVQLVGTGGSASILGAMELRLSQFDRDRIEGSMLDLARVRWHLDHLWSLPIEERRKIPGLPPERADVILTGVAIYAGVMRQFKLDHLRISTRGMRYAALADVEGRAWKPVRPT